MASLGTLAAGIAHEINNPLAYVTGNLEAAAESLTSIACSASGETCRDHADASVAISDARDGAERVRKIVHGLRLFSRSEEEKRVMQALKDKGLELYELIASIGKSRELSLALTKTEEAVMWAVKHLTR